MQNIKMPDITPAQLIAIVTVVVGQAVAWGWLDGSKEQMVVAISAAALAFGLKISDAIIRHGRAQIGAAQILAAAQESGRVYRDARGRAGTAPLHEADVVREGQRVVVRDDTTTGTEREGDHPAG